MAPLFLILVDPSPLVSLSLYFTLLCCYLLFNRTLLLLLPFKVLEFNVVSQDTEKLLESRRLLIVPKQLLLGCLRGRDT